MTAHELATILRISSKKVSAMHVAELLPAPLVVGCQHRWRREEIRGWLSEGCPPRAEWCERMGLSRR
jgi:hypothetical protein